MAGAPVVVVPPPPVRITPEQAERIAAACEAGREGFCALLWVGAGFSIGCAVLLLGVLAFLAVDAGRHSRWWRGRL